MEMTLKEGKNREIRRMCEAVGLEVIRLKRNAEGVVKLGMLQPGKYRELTKAEVNACAPQPPRAAPRPARPLCSPRLLPAVPAALWAGTRLPQGRNASEQCVRNFRSFCQICNIL